MEEEFEDFTEEQIEALISRFEKAVNNALSPYFDVEEFEEIIDYYDLMHNNSKMEDAITAATNIHPYHLHFRLKEAQRMISSKRFTNALQLLEELLEVEPTNFLVRQSLAYALSKVGKHKKAIDTYLETIEMGADAKEIWINIAYEYESLSQYPKAIECLKKIVALDYEDEGALYEILFCYEVDNKKEESVKFFQQFVDEHPYSHIAWFNLGISLSNLGLYEKAIEAYDYTLAIEEEFSSAYFNKANALINLKDYKKAIDNFEETFKYEEADGVTHLYIGQCYENLNDKDSALKHYFKAIELNDKIAEAYVNIALTYFNIQNYPKALPFIQEALLIEPENTDYTYILGDIYAEMEEYDKASKVYLEVIELKPDNEEIYFDLAGIYWNIEQRQTAFEILDLGIKQSKNNFRNYIRYGEFYYEKGDKNMAINYLSIAYNIDAVGSISLITGMTHLMEDEYIRSFLDEKSKV